MEEKCPCCGNHCPKDDLQCGRGKRYFEGGANSVERYERGPGGHNERGLGGGHRGAPEGEDKVITLLRRCGHTLHHGGDGEKMLSNLSEEEKVHLGSLLEKLLS